MTEELVIPTEELDDNTVDMLTTVLRNNVGRSAHPVCDAIHGMKYAKADAKGDIICIWSGGSSVNAYTQSDDFRQIGHWNIEFEEGCDKKTVVVANIDRHIEEENYPY